MVDIFADIEGRTSNGDNTDTFEERNTFPEDVEPEKDVAPLGDAVRTKVDFFQTHGHADDFGRTSGLFSLYDPDNPDRQLFDIIEQESIAITSPPFAYYKLNHHLQDIDPIFGEAVTRDAYSNPVVIYGNYEDPSPIIELSKYGINQAETLDIQFNYNYLLNVLGDQIREGDVLMSYDGKLWEVMSSIIIDESLWRAQHDNVKVIKLQREGIILPDLPAGIKRYFTAEPVPPE